MREIFICCHLILQIPFNCIYVLLWNYGIQSGGASVDNSIGIVQSSDVSKIYIFIYDLLIYKILSFSVQVLLIVWSQSLSLLWSTYHSSANLGYLMIGWRKRLLWCWLIVDVRMRVLPHWNNRFLSFFRAFFA